MNKYSGIFAAINYKNKFGEQKTKWKKVGEVFENEKGLSVNLDNFVDFQNMQCNDKESGSIKLKIFLEKEDSNKINFKSDDDIPF